MVSSAAEELRKAQSAIDDLLEAGDATGAIAYADALSPPDGNTRMGTALRAAVRTDSSSIHRSETVLQEAIALWRTLEPDENPDIDFNLANAHLAIWELAVRTHGGWSEAWNLSSDHLHAARNAYERIGRTSGAAVELRLESWTNAGNTYDIVGRDLEAITCYERALDLDPNFGMALGNRGSTLLSVARLAGVHRPTVADEARADLDAALANQESVVRHGGGPALAAFQSLRDKFPAGPPAPRREHPDITWDDPFLRWSYQNDLFLHVSHRCISQDTVVLDPLLPHAVTSAGRDVGGSLSQLLDAFNACKQAYLAARYAIWIGMEGSPPVTEHLEQLARRASFSGSGTEALWDMAPGIAIQAFAATADVLDKVANYLHLYLGVKANARIYFKNLGSSQPKGSHPTPLYARLTPCIDAPEWNRGVMALIALSVEVSHNSVLARYVDMRHAATHRFLIAHMAEAPASDTWITRTSRDDLRSESIALLRVARAALIYLARAVDIHEERSGREPPPGHLYSQRSPPHSPSRRYRRP